MSICSSEQIDNLEVYYPTRTC